MASEQPQTTDIADDDLHAQDVAMRLQACQAGMREIRSLLFPGRDAAPWPDLIAEVRRLKEANNAQ